MQFHFQLFLDRFIMMFKIRTNRLNEAEELSKTDLFSFQTFAIIKICLLKNAHNKI